MTNQTGRADFDLPPIPEEDGYILEEIAGQLVEYNGYRVASLRAYAIAAIEHDRKQRGEPKELTEPVIYERKVYHGSIEHSGYLRARFDRSKPSRVSFEWDDHRWRYVYTGFDDLGEYDLLQRPAPQPAEPVMSSNGLLQEFLDTAKIDGINRLDLTNLYEPVEAAQPCHTCNDNGIVGNILNAEPCPECTPADFRLINEMPPDAYSIKADIDDAIDTARAKP